MPKVKGHRVEQILLISGVPASGKSHFCRWLESTKGVLHFDVEKDGRVEKYGLQKVWLGCITGGTAKPLVESLHKVGPPIVWDWGFPPEAIRIVEMLKSEGVQIWWFDADYTAARVAFIKRGDVPVECLDRQMPKIVAAQRKIESLFRPNIITTLGPDGVRMEPEEIYRRIRGDSGSATV
jgi:hypothetical protein